MITAVSLAQPRTYGQVQKSEHHKNNKSDISFGISRIEHIEGAITEIKRARIGSAIGLAATVFDGFATKIIPHDYDIGIGVICAVLLGVSLFALRKGQNMLSSLSSNQ